MLTVGDMLRNEREKKGYTLKQVEKSIKVREKFLEAVEQNDWTAFTSKIYITGIIRNYSRFLGVDHVKMTAFFRRDYERKEVVQFNKRVSSRYLIPESRKFAVLGLFLLFVIFFGYFAFQLKLFLTPPPITITAPTQNTFFSEDKITVKGKTEKDAQITIFGDRIYQNKDGIFEYDFPLKKGKNVLTIEAVGANGKKSQITHTFIRD